MHTGSSPAHIRMDCHNVKERFRIVLISKHRLLSSDISIWAPDCGVSRVRTDDPLLAKQVLYQLSYNPA